MEQKDELSDLFMESTFCIKIHINAGVAAAVLSVSLPGQ
jgi:hypothetical protein